MMAHFTNKLNVGGFKVIEVDGPTIRKNLDEDFTNFGHHYTFSFIPKQELWVDKGAKSNEISFFIQRMLIEYKLMAAGKSYDDALEIADRAERAERAKTLEQIENNGAPPENIKIRLLKTLKTGEKIWLVDGKAIRDMLFPDFSEGGNWSAYGFIPPKEIWIDNDLQPKERIFILIHELYEARQMIRGLDYEHAHNKALNIEWLARRKLQDKVFKEAAEVQLCSSYWATNMDNISLLLIKLTKVFNRYGFHREAETVREILHAKQPSLPLTPIFKKVPRLKLPSGYTYTQDSTGLFSIRGRLYEGIALIPYDLVQHEIEQIEKREKTLFSIPGRSETTERVIINGPGLNIILFSGRIRVQSFRPLDDLKTWAFVDYIDGQETTIENLEYIRKNLKNIGGERPPGHLSETQLQTYAVKLKLEGKIEFEEYADDQTIQNDFRPYFQVRLPIQLAVSARHNKQKKTITLKTYDRTEDIEVKDEKPVFGYWVHVLNDFSDDKDFLAYIKNFKNINGEVSVSEVRDYHFLMKNYYLALILTGTPTYIYAWDVASKIDPWTGRRIVDPSKANVGGDPRTEAFLVPAQAHIEAVITNNQKYRDQASSLGYKVYSTPSAFSTGADIQVPKTIRDLAAPWYEVEFPNVDFAAAAYRIRAKQEQTSRQGFLFPEITSWMRANDGRIPGGGSSTASEVEPIGRQWNPELWDKDAGLMVVFPAPPKTAPPRHVKIYLPDHSTQLEPTSKYLIIEPVLRKPELLPPQSLPSSYVARPKNDERFALARLRRLVIQQGEPFQFLGKNSIQTTKKGLELFQKFLDNPPPMPKRYTEKIAFFIPISKWDITQTFSSINRCAAEVQLCPICGEAASMPCNCEEDEECIGERIGLADRTAEPKININRWIRDNVSNPQNSFFYSVAIAALFGFTLMRKYEHYWVEDENGSVIDPTAQQYKDDYSGGVPVSLEAKLSEAIKDPLFKTLNADDQEKILEKSADPISGRNIGNRRYTTLLPFSKLAENHIKALSIKQPWANMIANGQKTIETRKWDTKYRGPLLIVSTAKPNIEPAGQALAIAELVDCRPMTKEDERAAGCEIYPSAFSWVLGNVRKIKPFPVKGSLGLYNVVLNTQSSLFVPLSKRAIIGNEVYWRIAKDLIDKQYSNSGREAFGWRNTPAGKSGSRLLPKVPVDVRQYLDQHLPKNVVVKEIEGDEGTFKLVPRQFELKPIQGRWMHVVNVEIPSLKAFLPRFANLHGEVCFSATMNTHTAFLSGGDFLAIVMDGPARMAFSKDVWSDFDPWTGRRFISSGRSPAPMASSPGAQEAWVVPAEAKVVAILTDNPEYIKEAKEIGVSAFGSKPFADRKLFEPEEDEKEPKEWEQASKHPLGEGWKSSQLILPFSKWAEMTEEEEIAFEKYWENLGKKIEEEERNKPKRKRSKLTYDELEMLAEMDPEEKEEWLNKYTEAELFIPLSKRAKSKSHKFIGKRKEESGNITYLYDEKHIKERNKKKEKRLSKLNKSLKKMRAQVKKDLTSKDEKTQLSALAVALIDETYERIGNEESATDLKHYGVTGWLLKHITFGKNKATIKYVGKAGVKQTKEVKTKPVLAALKRACEGKKKDDKILGISGKTVNAYLSPFGVTAKDIRGFHANKEMLRSLKENGKGKLPKDGKEREKELKNRFKAALEDAAKRVGHEPGTLKRQYLIPSIEQNYMEGKGIGSILASNIIPFSKTAKRHMVKEEFIWIWDSGIHRGQGVGSPHLYVTQNVDNGNEIKGLDHLTLANEIGMSPEDISEAPRGFVTYPISGIPEVTTYGTSFANLLETIPEAYNAVERKFDLTPGAYRQTVLPMPHGSYKELMELQPVEANFPMSKRASFGTTLTPPKKVLDDIYNYVFPLYASAIISWIKPPPSPKEFVKIFKDNDAAIEDFYEKKYSLEDGEDPNKLLPIEGKGWWWNWDNGRISAMPSFVIKLQKHVNGNELNLICGEKSIHLASTTDVPTDNWMRKILINELEEAINIVQEAKRGLENNKYNYNYQEIYDMVKKDASGIIELPSKYSKEFLFPDTNEKYLIIVELDPHAKELRACLKNTEIPTLLFKFGEDYISIQPIKEYNTLKNELISSIEHEAVHLMQRLQAHRKKLLEVKMGLPPVKVRNKGKEWEKPHSLIEAEFYPNLIQVENELRTNLQKNPLERRWNIFEQMVGVKGLNENVIYSLLVLKEKAYAKWKLAMKILLSKLSNLMPPRNL